MDLLYIVIFEYSKLHFINTYNEHILSIHIMTFKEGICWYQSLFQSEMKSDV